MTCTALPKRALKLVLVQGPDYIPRPRPPEKPEDALELVELLDEWPETAGSPEATEAYVAKLYGFICGEPEPEPGSDPES
jgi:hypothetical protein